MTFYDSLARHKTIEKFVTRQVGNSHQRKYWRFRVDRWYGGIVTADAVGCGLLCKFCWVSDQVMSQPVKFGKFYDAESVANIFAEMAGRRELGQIRVSGGEPTIGRDHLFSLLNSLKHQDLVFILETNGILIGEDRNYAEQLSRFPFVHVRVSLKGCNETEFAELTGAKPDGFALQLKALENLTTENVRCHPAVMVSFSSEDSLQTLVKRMRSIDQRLTEELEVEELILYPSVQRKIRRYGLKYHRSHTPDRVPKELI